MGLNRTVAAIFGVVYLVAGVAGFVLATPIFGLFDVNALHNIVHIVIGAVLLYAMMDTANAVMANRVIGVVLIALGILGFFVTNPAGLIPIGGADVWLHLASGVILAIVGFMGARTMATA
jgi:Domain of unknown function (DUF4383)